MRIRIAYTIEVDDEYRKAINAWYGRKGKATREQVIAWVRSNGESMDEQLCEVWEDIQRENV